MKAEELKSNIHFSSMDFGVDLTAVTGTLQITASQTYSRKEAEMSNGAIVIHCKDRICEMIIGAIYDDQRKEMYDALMDLVLASPFDYEAISLAKEKILLAAKRQQP